jgi:hypothetical protein
MGARYFRFCAHSPLATRHSPLAIRHSPFAIRHSATTAAITDKTDHIGTMITNLMRHMPPPK